MIFDNFFLGNELNAYKFMGCHKVDDGIEFYLWAPHADQVDVYIKDDNMYYPMEKVFDKGIWHLFLDNHSFNNSYYYRISTDKKIVNKIDPYSFYIDRSNQSCSFMYDIDDYVFDDEKYMKNRHFSYENPLNIYEIHLNGFKHKEKYANYCELKEHLIPYVKDMGYSHIEIMPIAEHPYGGSWGYQATGFYSPTSRYGLPNELKDFINECHKNNIGVILDVAYLHFATDEYALGNFDLKPCYEKDTVISKWGSYLFDHSKNEVISFLISNANYYLKEFHFDGLRLDAVSDLIYNDGLKEKGINYEGINFIKKLNSIIKKENPDCILIAEDSTDYPDVTKPCSCNGLGFDYKWDLGWMNDTLKYYSLNHDNKKDNHNLITFSMSYFYKEKYLLPFSHDEVVFMKKTIVDKMFGEYEDKFSLCRNLFIYMFTHPGKKLNFLGNDIAMFREFNDNEELDWKLLKYPIHDSFHRFFKDLSFIFNSYKAFFSLDYSSSSFNWIDPNNSDQSVYSYFRKDDEYIFIIVLNMKPITYNNFSLNVPYNGKYVELINSQKDIYNGCNLCNDDIDVSDNLLIFTLAPFSGIIFKHKYK